MRRTPQRNHARHRNTARRARRHGTWVERFDSVDSVEASPEHDPSVDTAGVLLRRWARRRVERAKVGLTVSTVRPVLFSRALRTEHRTSYDGDGSSAHPSE